MLLDCLRALVEGRLRATLPERGPAHCHLSTGATGGTGLIDPKPPGILLTPVSGRPAESFRVIDLVPRRTRR